jgi:hypothetical protein
MVMLDVVFNWEARRVVDSHVALESKKNARDLKRQQFRVGSRVMSLDIDGPTTKKPQNTIGTTEGHTACVGSQSIGITQVILTRHSSCNKDGRARL